MADIFQDEFLSSEEVENLFCSGDTTEEEKKDEEEKTEQEEVQTSTAKVEVVDVEPKIPTLEELADSDFIRNRQLAAKSIVEYLHQAGSNKEALHSVISVMCKLLEDEDLMVRSELMEHIPAIALFCKERSEDLGVVIRQQIVPYTVKLITDIQLPIRKVGHTTLLVLLGNNIIDNSHLTEWICPLVAQLATSGNSPEDVSVMCKMIPYVGKEITEKFFLEPFLLLCCDRTASSREVCLLHFGNLARVLGRESTESVLLPVFLDLCKDELSVGTDKIQCVDIAVDLAGVVSPTTRHEVLSRVYIEFLNEKSSRSVWYAAYLSLGRFISTFADPSKTGLSYKDGLWIGTPYEDEYTEDEQNNLNYFDRLDPQITSTPQFLDKLSVSKFHVFYIVGLFKKGMSQSNCETALSEKINDENSNFNSQVTDRQSTLNSEKKPNNNSPLSVATKDGHLYLHVDNENLFNNFQFWRTPLPEVELDIDIEECKSANISVKAKIHNEDNKSQSCSSELNVRISPNQSSRNVTSTILRTDFDAKIIQDDENPSSLESITFNECIPLNRFNRAVKEKGNCRKSIYDQNIVPPELLLEYVDDLPVEEDMRISFAYYFPSVAYTLGKKHWPCIRGTFHWLATDITYNVKKSVASSLHELAVILGRDITRKDLFPVFCEMLTDEKLRAIVLKHVSQFLKNLRPSDRKQFLQLLKGLCIWEEESDWRYRLTVAEQLIPCIELYTSCEALHFFSVSLTLLQDRVCAVRKAAVELLAVSLSVIVTNPKSTQFIKAALSALDEKYRKSNKWLWRQVYVYICQELAVRRSLPTELYVNEIIPNLFSLSWDTVPNVRLAVARCLGLTLLPLDFLPSIQRAHYQLLLQVMYSLQSDVDRDVRHFAHLSAAAFNVLPPKKLSPA